MKKCAYDRNRICDSNCAAYKVTKLLASLVKEEWAECGRGDFVIERNENDE